MKTSKWRIYAVIPVLLFTYCAGFALLHMNVFLEAVMAHTIPAPEANAHVPQIFHLKATAYNAVEAQTDSTPHITATGTRAVPGVVAAARDVLESIPYGSLVKVIEVTPRADVPNGCGGTWEHLKEISPYGDAIFRVEDTMHARKRQQIDFLMAEVSDAEKWGVCDVQVVRVR